MEYIRISAKTVDDAITEASIQLGTSSDNIEYEVVEKGSTGVVWGNLFLYPFLYRRKKSGGTL